MLECALPKAVSEGTTKNAHTQANEQLFSKKKIVLPALLDSLVQKKGNYIHVDTDFILNDNLGQF